MREAIISGFAFVGLAALGITVAVRDRTPHTPSLAPAAAASASSASSAVASGSAPVGSAAASVAVGVVAASASAPAGSGSAAAEASGPAPAGSAPAGAALMERPLRVAILGWELAVPLVAANRGLEPGPQGDFARGGLDVRLSVTDRLSAVENALARGGGDREGADIAVLPLPSFAAGYERLRALNPEIFFVVGWSRGRDALMADKELLTSPEREVAIAGDEGTAAMFLGLFALDLAGYSGPKLKIVPPSKASEAQASAQDRSSPFEGVHRRALLSTADATRLVPYVAVAQRSLIERNGPALSAWAKGWMAGQKQVEADPAAAARTVGAVPGAPGPLPLLKGLGEMQPATLADSVRSMGLSGRSGATLESLFQQSFRVWKGAGLMNSPAPESAPISTAIVTALARSEAVQAPASPPKLGPDKGKALLVYRQKEGEVDERALESMVGLLAGSFERSVLRVSLKKGGAAAAKKLFESAQGTYDIAAGRLVVGDKTPDKAGAAVEVLLSP